MPKIFGPQRGKACGFAVGPRSSGLSKGSEHGQVIGGTFNEPPILDGDDY